MRKTIGFFSLMFLFSCTSNTIFEPPEDLIPKDTMELLIKDMLIASSSRYFNNRNLQKNIDYMPFVYKKYGIDSARFGRSNFYYMSRIDDYRLILENVKNEIDKEKTYYTDLKDKQDSIRKDSINKARQLSYQKKDSLKRAQLNKDQKDSTILVKKQFNTDSLIKAVKARLKKRRADTIDKKQNQL